MSRALSFNSVRRIARDRLFVSVVLAPLLLLGAYYLFYAEWRYVVETRVTLRSTQTAQTAGLLAGLAGGSDLRQDELHLVDRVHSPDVALSLADKEGLRKAWDIEAGTDFLNRLVWRRTDDDVLALYRQKVVARLDPATGGVVLRVEDFDPSRALRLSQALLAELDTFTNRMSSQLARELTSSSLAEVERTAKELTDAQDALSRFQRRVGALDTEAEGRARGELIASLTAEASKLEAEVRQLRSYLAADSMQVRTAEQRLAATQSQIRAERSRVTGDSARFNERVIEQERLKAAVALSQERHRLALSAADSMRIEATRKAKTLVVVSTPREPQRARYPRYAYEFSVSTLVLLCLYGIARMLVALVREHRG